MQIGIIGSGNIGGTLARRFQELGHDVTLANSRGPQSLTDFAEETGVTPGTVADAAAHDVVVVAIPLKAVPDLPTDAFAGRVVVDTSNYYTRRDGTIAEIDGGKASARWVSEQLPGSRVVKVFNSIYSSHLHDKGVPPGTKGRIGLPVAADDAEAKRIVSGLVDQLGFDPVDAGSLDESWRQEPGTLVYGTDLDAAGVEKGLADAKR
jgi:8-hydroxy-5-deazaflavin:NADPH oxidoreductase